MKALGSALASTLSVMWGFTRRLFFAVFFVLGGFLFAIPKWILMGTKGGRERRKLIKQQKELLKRTA